jgi:hypothetical protein
VPCSQIKLIDIAPIMDTKWNLIILISRYFGHLPNGINLVTSLPGTKVERLWSFTFTPWYWEHRKISHLKPWTKKAYRARKWRRVASFTLARLVFGLTWSDVIVKRITLHAFRPRSSNL